MQFACSLFTCKCGCCTFHCFGEQQQQRQGVLCSCERLFCLVSLCMYFPTCLFLLLFCVQSMETMGLTHTHRYLSEMPSGGYLCFPDILHQTISATVYSAGLCGANKSNRSQDMCMVWPPATALLFQVRIHSVHPLMVFSPSDVCFYRMRRSLSRR